MGKTVRLLNMAGTKYEVYVHKGRPIWKIVTGILFSHMGLFVLCIGYGALGAYIFILLERGAEDLRYDEKLNRTKDVDASIDYLKSIFYHYATNVERYNYTRNQYREAVYADLDTLKKFVVDYYNSYKYDMTEDWETSWDFPKAFLFTITLMTTVGYGHIAPQTLSGKMFCILYALIGIPLMLVFSGEIGDLMADGFRWIYSRICCRWCRVRRRHNELPSSDEPTIPPEWKIKQDEIGKETYMPTDKVNVPIMVNLMLIFTFLFLGAVAFSNWENWDLGTALYFCFITLTTIGFGDVWPRESFLHYADGVGPFMKMVVTIVYSIFGMALVSMCIQLMQEQIMEKIRWLMTEIGMGGKSNEEMVKVTKQERLKQTPADMTGNELDFNEKRRKKNMNKSNMDDSQDDFFEEPEV